MSNSWDFTKVLKLIMDRTACKRKTNGSKSGWIFSYKISNMYYKPLELTEQLFFIVKSCTVKWSIKAIKKHLFVTMSSYLHNKIINASEKKYKEICQFMWGIAWLSKEHQRINLMNTLKHPFHKKRWYPSPGYKNQNQNQKTPPKLI